MSNPSVLRTSKEHSEVGDLLPELRSTDPAVRLSVVKRLAAIFPPNLEAITALATAAKCDSDANVRAMAIAALQQAGVDIHDVMSYVDDAARRHRKQ